MGQAVRYSILVIAFAICFAAPLSAKAQDLQACSCTEPACGNGSTEGDAGDVFIEITQAEVDQLFQTGPDTGWTCVVPASLFGEGGPLACFCENFCGNGGVGADPDTFRLGLTQETVDQSFGGGALGNPTGWVCGNYRGSVAEDGPPQPGAFEVNAGLNDAWGDPDTDGQGFFIAVFPDTGAMSLAWFTFDVERPEQGVTAMLGGPGQRWLTAIGDWEGNLATLTVEQVTGGVFDQATPPVERDPDYGTITIEFHDCNNATLTYDIPSLMLMGSIEIVRIVPDNSLVCEALASP